MDYPSLMAQSLKEVVSFLDGEQALAKTELSDLSLSSGVYQDDFSDIKGQASAKRAIRDEPPGNPGHHPDLLGSWIAHS